MISASVKLRETKVGLCEGTAEMSSRVEESLVQSNLMTLCQNKPWSTPTPRGNVSERPLVAKISSTALTFALSTGTSRYLGGQFPSEGIFTSLSIKGGTSHRVQKDLALHVAEVWWMFLDLDELVFNHHFAHGLVRKERPLAVPDLVRLIVRRLDSS